MSNFTLRLNGSTLPPDMTRIGDRVFVEPTPAVTEADIHVFVRGNLYNLDDIRRLFFYETNPAQYTGDTSLDQRVLMDQDLLVFLYKTYGLPYLLQLVDGCFSMVILDQRLERECAHVYVVTDPYGIHPVYWSETSTFTTFTTLCCTKYLTPGTWSEWTLSCKAQAEWGKRVADIPYRHHIQVRPEPRLDTWDACVRYRFGVMYPESPDTQVLYISDDPGEFARIRDLLPESARHLTWEEAEDHVPSGPVRIFVSEGMMVPRESCKNDVDYGYQVREALRDAHAQPNGYTLFQAARARWESQYTLTLEYPMLDQWLVEKYIKHTTTS